MKMVMKKKCAIEEKLYFVWLSEDQKSEREEEKQKEKREEENMALMTGYREKKTNDSWREISVAGSWNLEAEMKLK